MYRTGDTVMYGSFGICTVTSVETCDFTGEEQEYYVLRQTSSDKNVFYVPVDNAAALDKMRPVCTKAEIDELIASMDSEELIWIEDDTRRRKEYSGIIRGADKHEIISLIKTLYLRRRELAEKGKKLRSSDESCLDLAENMLYEEFAYVLGIDKSEVVSYIAGHIHSAT